MENIIARLRQIAGIIRTTHEARYSPYARDETPRDLMAIAAEIEEIATRMEQSQ